MLLYACKIISTLKAIDLYEERTKSDRDMLRYQKATFSMFMFKATETLFFYYMLYFLLYLITCFAKENKVDEVHDTLLGRKVPTIVYLQNKRLMKDAIQRKVEHDSENRKALLLQAKLNEEVYSMLKEFETAKFEEKISMEFMIHLDDIEEDLLQRDSLSTEGRISAEVYKVILETAKSLEDE